MSQLELFLKTAQDTAEPQRQAEAWEHLTRILRSYVRASMPSEMRADCDSEDVVQSVIASFIEAFNHEQIAFSGEGQLKRYLQTVVRHRLIDLNRRRQALRRGRGRRRLPIGPDEDVGEVDPIARAHSASASVAARQLEQRVRLLLSAEEAEVWGLYRQGASWAELGQRLNATAEAARKRVARLRERLQEGLEP